MLRFVCCGVFLGCVSLVAVNAPSQEPASVLQPSPATENASATPPRPLPQASAASLVPGGEAATAGTATVAPATGAAAPANDSLAHFVLHQLLTPPAEATVAGQPLTLSQLLSRVAAPRQRIEAVAAYWQLSRDLAAYYCALDERARLQAVAEPASSPERELYSASQAAVEATLHRAEISLLESQYMLLDAAQLPWNDQLPLPVEMPLAEAYRTQLDRLFPTGPVPVQFYRIDRTLPYRLRHLEAQAAVVQAQEQAWEALVTAHEAGNVSIHELCAQHRQLAQQRRFFLEAVLDYNRQIADYALTIAGPTLDVSAVVAMLVKQDPALRSVLVPRNAVQPATALEPVPSPRTAPAATPPSAFREATPASPLFGQPTPAERPE